MREGTQSLSFEEPHVNSNAATEKCGLKISTDI
jgi:hypothetical protein